ncbi:hypothetical protein [Actibacterium sp. 188UL27-1]|uniref:hypothetical protein n=1 Tax=Actibacterium sp. 188UL27-1 TaxID=2786961 RepID=UPI00195DE28C|nr:hypothetical protein [Actibacterium sp. 188UL27-1]MBM7068521.1 hypothetical protein [Actibacterium sp. 188UL27-1]
MWRSAALALLLVAVPAAAQQAVPELYPETAEVRPDMPFDLSPEQQNAFDEFVSPPAYFGAFAASRDGAYGWFYNANDLATAQDFALNYCETSRADGPVPRCVVIATVVPEGFAGPAQGTLRHKAATDLAKLRSSRRYSGKRAMAASGGGAYGYVYNMPTRKSAEREALYLCERYAKRGTKDLPPAPCNVVWISR